MLSCLFYLTLRLNLNNSKHEENIGFIDDGFGGDRYCLG